MDSWERQTRATAFFRRMLSPFIIRVFALEYERIPLDGGYLFLCNHNTDYDPIFVGLAAKGPLRYVASEHIMRKGLGTRFLKYFFNPIIISKGALAANTTIEMLRSMKRGQPVCMFPEGNRSFSGVTGSIPQVTGKLARKCGVPLVTYRLRGGYLTQPRWGTSIRRGKLSGELVNIYTPEQLNAMTNEEVNEAIRRDLRVDAYGEGEPAVPYRGKNPALGLETVLFCCPRCASLGSLTSTPKEISCSCGFRADYGEDGRLRSGDMTYTVTTLDLLQREKLIQRVMHSGDAPLFSDAVTAQEIGENHEAVRELQGLLEAFPDRVRFAGKEIPTDQITGAAVHSRCGLTVYYGPEHTQYEIRGTRFWNALKYLYLYNIIHERELF